MPTARSKATDLTEEMFRPHERSPGMRTYFGKQIQSDKTTSPAFGFGGGTRDAQSKVGCLRHWVSGTRRAANGRYLCLKAACERTYGYRRTAGPTCRVCGCQLSRDLVATYTTSCASPPLESKVRGRLLSRLCKWVPLLNTARAAFGRSPLRALVQFHPDARSSGQPSTCASPARPPASPESSAPEISSLLTSSAHSIFVLPAAGLLRPFARWWRMIAHCMHG